MKQLEKYRDWLVGPGVERGLIGPREADRIWERHIDNCLAVVEADSPVPEASTVLDLGSGAGLPGIVWAVARPDLSVTLLEPQERRTRFLHEVVEDLGLSNVSVLRGRAQEVDTTADVVTARALAGLTSLLAWSAPLVAPGGRMVFLKGQRAPEELSDARGWLRRQGWRADVRQVGERRRARVVVVVRGRDG